MSRSTTLGKSSSAGTAVQVEKLAQHSRETIDIRLVERGVDFVEDAEGTRLAAEDGEQQGNGGERLFAAAQERNTAQLLAGRAGDDADSGRIDRERFEWDPEIAEA